MALWIGKAMNIHCCLCGGEEGLIFFPLKDNKKALVGTLIFCTKCPFPTLSETKLEVRQNNGSGELRVFTVAVNHESDSDWKDS